MATVYVAINVITGLPYVGSTALTLEKRKFLQGTKYLKNSSSLSVAVRELGIDSFEYFALDEIYEDEREEAEAWWIEYFDSYYHGYNGTHDGQSFNCHNRGTPRGTYFRRYKPFKMPKFDLPWFPRQKLSIMLLPASLRRAGRKEGC